MTWREGSRHPLRSRFAAVRIRAAHRDHKLHQPRELEWLPIEWPRGEDEPTKYWMSNLAENSRLRALVALAKQRWIIERDYRELKQELGLGHFEGRGWRGFHHHATLSIAAYGFLVAERCRFSPSARSGITPTPSLPCASPWPAPCSATSANVPSAVCDAYNTVVLAACPLSQSLPLQKARFTCRECRGFHALKKRIAFRRFHWQKMFSGVRKGGMSDIVQQSREPDDLPIPRKTASVYPNTSFRVSPDVVTTAS